jgi:hypothetical protein
MTQKRFYDQEFKLGAVKLAQYEDSSDLGPLAKLPRLNRKPFNNTFVLRLGISDGKF